MKLGFNTAILPEYNFEQIIDFATENSFACVEVVCWPQGKADRYMGVTRIDMGIDRMGIVYKSLHTVADID